MTDDLRLRHAVPGASEAPCEVCGDRTWLRIEEGDGFVPICCMGCLHAWPKTRERIRDANVLRNLIRCGEIERDAARTKAAHLLGKYKAARTALLATQTIIAGFVRLVSSACPDADMWDREGGLADQCDDSVALITSALEGETAVANAEDYSTILRQRDGLRDLLNRILGDEGPDIDAYLDGHADVPDVRRLCKDLDSALSGEREAAHQRTDLRELLSTLVTNYDADGRVDDSWWQAAREAVKL